MRYLSIGLVLAAAAVQPAFSQTLCQPGQVLSDAGLLCFGQSPMPLVVPSIGSLGSNQTLILPGPLNVQSTGNQGGFPQDLLPANSPPPLPILPPGPGMPSPAPAPFIVQSTGAIGSFPQDLLLNAPQPGILATTPSLPTDRPPGTIQLQGSTGVIAFPQDLLSTGTSGNH
jgi:hypothetical protein